MTPEQLNLLADWFDLQEPLHPEWSGSHQVQDDLRKHAKELIDDRQSRVASILLSFIIATYLAITPLSFYLFYIIASQMYEISPVSAWTFILMGIIITYKMFEALKFLCNELVSHLKVKGIKK